MDYLDPFYNEILEGAERFSRQLDYNLVLSIASSKKPEIVVESLIQKSAVDGVIISGTKKIVKEKAIIEQLDSKGIPIVLVGHSLGKIPNTKKAMIYRIVSRG